MNDDQTDAIVLLTFLVTVLAFGIVWRAFP